MHPQTIHIDEYNYPLPEEKIARFPLSSRSDSKLLVLKNGKIEHQLFKELSNIIPGNSLLVLNNTRVIHARIIFQKASGSKIEILLLHPSQNISPENLLVQISHSTWQVMVGNKKKWKEDEILKLETSDTTVEAKWIDRSNNIIQLSYTNNKTLNDLLPEIGQLPIPPYLNRKTEEIDIDRYQTTYNSSSGSVAAPTAGLHFTPEIFSQLKLSGIQTAEVTLHVGAGTFKPVSVENAVEHPMHEEAIYLNIDVIQQLLQHQGPIIPIGTTSLRTIESIYWFGVGLLSGELINCIIPQDFPYQIHESLPSRKESLEAVIQWLEENNLYTLVGQTSIYIMPGYQFKIANGLFTNFHQPKSTLLLLVAALIGDQWKEVYQEALAQDYRFLSYGDACLFLP